MAGGQERILRRRIKSVQATKKITRAMELIAGVPDRARPAARRTPRCPTPSASPRSSGTWPQAGEQAESPLLQARPEIKKVCYIVIVADRGLCGAYNTNVLPRRRGRDQAATSSTASTTRSWRSAARPRATSGSGATRSTPPSRASATTPPTPTPARWPTGPSSASWPASSTGCARVHPLRVGRLPGGRHPAAGSAGGRAGGGAATPSGSKAGYEFEPSTRRRSSSRSCPATSRPASTPPCSTPRRRSTPPASGP